MIQNGIRFHTSKATLEFMAQHKDRLFVYQLPSCCPNSHPIEYLWRKMKTKATHCRSFDEFVRLIQSVKEALGILAIQMDKIKRLMGMANET